MNVPVILGSSVIAALVGALVGAVIKGLWDRRAAKKGPKTEMRAEAYRDFVIHVVSTAHASFVVPDEIKARLLLSGESNVVAAVSRFLHRHASLDNEAAIADFTTVVCEMRRSLVTGHGSTVAKNIHALLSTQTSHTAARHARVPDAG